MPILFSSRSLTAALALALFTFNATEALAKFRPKEYDLTLTTQVTNCEIQQPVQGLCEGGNWAHVFAQSLYYTQCLQASAKQPTLSSEELLQCTTTTTSFDRCAITPQDLDIVDAVKSYLLTSGLTTQACRAYQQTQSFNLNAACPTQCDDGSSKMMQVKAKELFSIANIVTDIQDHIITYGPAVMAISAAQSLNEYTSNDVNSPTVYAPTANEPTFGVRFLLIVGWSTVAAGQPNAGEVQWKGLATFGSQYGAAGRMIISATNPNIQALYGIKIK